MHPFSAGIIGCGVMGEHYARVITGDQHTRLAAVCDLDRPKAEGFSKRWQAPSVFASVADMLRVGGLDGVIVATPDFAHQQPVCACLEAGLPVLCEKPLATTLQDADAIVEAQAKTTLPLMVNFGNRHRSNAQRIRQIVESGELGTIEHVYVRLNERLCKTKTIAWLGRTSPVWFLLSHCVDLVRWILGDEFRDVFARASYGVVDRLQPGVPDVVSALCTTVEGVCVNLESCWIMPDAYFGNIDFALQVVGREGVIQADLFPHDLQVHRHGGAMVEDYSMDVRGPRGTTMGWWEESVKQFFRALQTGVKPTPSAEDAREVTRTLVALEQSLETGATVEVSSA